MQNSVLQKPIKSTGSKQLVETNLTSPNTIVILQVIEELGSLQTVLVAASDQGYIILTSSNFDTASNFKSTGKMEVK